MCDLTASTSVGGNGKDAEEKMRIKTEVLDGPSTSTGISERETDDDADDIKTEISTEKVESPSLGDIDPGVEHDHNYCKKRTENIDSHESFSFNVQRRNFDDKSYVVMKCDVCGKSCFSPFELKNHMETHSGEKCFGCRVCGKRFLQFKGLQEHMKLHSERQCFECDICHKRLSRPSSLQRHVMIHWDRKPFKCGICDKAYSGLESLSKHMKLHDEGKIAKCDICDKRFPVSGLELHRMSHSRGSEFPTEHDIRKMKETKCRECGKTFRHPCLLRNHVRIHTGEKPFECGVCKKEFTKPDSLRQHMRLHTDKCLKCEVCGKKFPTQQNLDRHMPTHTGEKNYKCGICTEEFTQQYHLQRHMAIHTGETKYECDVCEKRFYRKCHLQKHVKVHSKKKCTRPSKYKKKNVVIKKLKKEVHESGPDAGDTKGCASCTVCEKSFLSSDGLDRHMRQHRKQKKRD